MTDGVMLSFYVTKTMPVDTILVIYTGYRAPLTRLLIYLGYAADKQKI